MFQLLKSEEQSLIFTFMQQSILGLAELGVEQMRKYESEHTSRTGSTYVQTRTFAFAQHTPEAFYNRI